MLLDHLSESQRGIVSLSIGIVLLCYILGIFSTFLSYVLGIIAIALIVLGFLQSGLYTKCMNLIQKKHK